MHQCSTVTNYSISTSLSRESFNYSLSFLDKTERNIRILLNCSDSQLFENIVSSSDLIAAAHAFVSNSTECEAVFDVTSGWCTVSRKMKLFLLKAEREYADWVGFIFNVIIAAGFAIFASVV